MARILVADTNPAMRRLLELRLARLGHEALPWDGDDPGDADVDLAIVETADVEALALARALRRARPELPIVVSSSRGRSLETASLAPAAHLLKPYALSRLAAALDVALELARPLARAA
jgi:CheY-like chemotaxis protein